MENVCNRRLFSFPAKIVSLYIRYKNVACFNLVHAHKPIIFLLQLSSQISFLQFTGLPFFLAVYSRYLLSAIFFLDAVKSLVFIMGRAWKWDLDQLYMWI